MLPDAPHEVAAKSIVARIESVILFPLIALMMSLALLVFMWGVYQYVLHADDQSARETGRQHMLYGVIGFVVMVSAYALLTIVSNTFGVTVPAI